MDSLLSIVQMPAGIPVGTLAIGRAGAINAALLAATIVGLGDAKIMAALERWRARQTEAVAARAVGRRRRPSSLDERMTKTSAAGIDHRHPGRRPARPHDATGRGAARLSLHRLRPGGPFDRGRRRGRPCQRRLRRQGRPRPLRRRRSTSSPTSSRTCPRRPSRTASGTSRCGPGVRPIHFAQHRLREKEFFRQLGIGTADYQPIASDADIAAATAAARHPEDLHRGL